MEHSDEDAGYIKFLESELMRVNELNEKLEQHCEDLEQHTEREEKRKKVEQIRAAHEAEIKRRKTEEEKKESSS